MLNPVVYGTKTAVDDVLDDLKKYMYTKEYINVNINVMKSEPPPPPPPDPKKPEKHSPEVISNSPIISRLSSDMGSNNYAHGQPAHNNIPIAGPHAIDTQDGKKKRLHKCPAEQSLFWSIYIATKGYGEYMREQRRAANVWIEERLRIVDHLKKAPRQLKESNHKLTLESIQALLSSMIMMRQDREEDAILYSAYHNIPIVILYEKTAVVFDNGSARWNPSAENSEQKTIYLEARTTKRIGLNKKQIMEYTLVEPETVATKIDNMFIVENLGIGLRSVSSYKTDELRTLVKKHLGVEADRMTKPELYENMAKWVAIDRCFI